MKWWILKKKRKKKIEIEKKIETEPIHWVSFSSEVLVLGQGLILHIFSFSSYFCLLHFFYIYIFPCYYYCCCCCCYYSIFINFILNCYAIEEKYKLYFRWHKSFDTSLRYVYCLAVDCLIVSRIIGIVYSTKIINCNIHVCSTSNIKSIQLSFSIKVRQDHWYTLYTVQA